MASGQCSFLEKTSSLCVVLIISLTKILIDKNPPYLTLFSHCIGRTRGWTSSLRNKRLAIEVSGYPSTVARGTLSYRPRHANNGLAISIIYWYRVTVFWVMDFNSEHRNLCKYTKINWHTTCSVCVISTYIHSKDKWNRENSGHAFPGKKIPKLEYNKSFLQIEKLLGNQTVTWWDFPSLLML